jgi:uncharacterized protein YbcC (UPF0753/DUF2309 family)
MVEIHLYGRLRRYADDPRPDQQSVIRLQPQPDETLETLLARLSIPTAEVYHVFLNGALLSTRNSMSPWLGYQSVRQRHRPAALDEPVRSGDRVGLFAGDMALLVV